MITNLHRVNYDGTPHKKGDWWVWKETCDKCGKLILDETVLHSYNPDDLYDTTFCSDCIRYLMDNDIPYKEAAIKYKKENR